MEWQLKERDRESGYELYVTSKEFNGDTYVVLISVYKTLKADRFWVAVSSGKKRKHIDIFEDKDYKSKGGIKALLWVKDAVFNFPEFYGNPFNKKQYACILWSDSRRRDIYQRLEKYGFTFVFEGGQKILRKSL